ncbi:MAG: RelA/SpoT family protein [Nevskiales bacterium]
MAIDLPGISKLSTAIRTTRVSRAYGIDALEKLLREYLSEAQIMDVRRAAEFAERAHKGQFRKSGEPYVYHPLAVARILAEMRMDHTTLIAAILHDVVEDTPTAVDEVAARFGPDVATLVDGVSKLSKAQHQTREEVQAENVRKLLMAMVQDIRVILVKLADRLHNMRTLDSVPPAKRKRVAAETLEIYAPIAHRLGIHTLRVELEDLGFSHRYPNRHRVLTRAIQQVSSDQRDLVREVEQRIEGAMAEEGIAGSVVGRRKNLYSIYLKMRRKNLRFLEVMDLFGFRVLVDQVDECYRALGIVHHVYRPISDQFNDFIANPKANGYQSLHTTLVGPRGIKIEVQIRTRQMHQIAESGVAAHWQYKLGDDGAGRAPDQRARDWLGNLVEFDEAEGTAQEFVENVKIDLFPDEVYVFTPKGEIRRLPKGASPVDFAYAIHTDLGNHCVAARIDQHLVPLATALQNGQTVEIITARHAIPNPAWLNFTRTAKARASIRHYLKDQRVDQAERLGQRLLNKSLRELGVSVRRINRERMDKALAQMGEPNLQQLYISIGLGKRLAPLAARHFLADKEVAVNPRSISIAVEGTEGLVVEYAKCCNPIPGDVIIGHVSTGRGVVIHRHGCRFINSSKARELIDLRWSKRVRGDFTVEIKVQAESKRGVLASMSAQISECDSNIEKVVLPERSDEVAVTRFRISVRDRQHLAQVMRRLRRQDVVQKVTRG